MRKMCKIKRISTEPERLPKKIKKNSTKEDPDDNVVFYKHSIECPITLFETTFPCMIIDSILINKELLFDNYNELLYNPLSILDNKKIVNFIKSSFNNYISYHFYMKDKNNNINPYNRNEILGIIPLTSDSNLLTMGNRTLDKLFDNKKSTKLKFDSNILFIIIFIIIKNLNRFKDIKNNLYEHVQYRIENINMKTNI